MKPERRLINMVILAGMVAVVYGEDLHAIRNDAGNVVFFEKGKTALLHVNPPVDFSAQVEGAADIAFGSFYLLNTKGAWAVLGYSDPVVQKSAKVAARMTYEGQSFAGAVLKDRWLVKGTNIEFRLEREVMIGDDGKVVMTFTPQFAVGGGEKSVRLVTSIGLPRWLYAQARIELQGSKGEILGEADEMAKLTMGKTFAKVAMLKVGRLSLGLQDGADICVMWDKWKPLHNVSISIWNFGEGGGPFVMTFDFFGANKPAQNE